MRPRFQARPSLYLLVPCAALLLACQSPPPQTAGATPSSGAALGPDAAASRIAAARCDHEVACGSVGPGQTYPGRDQCEAELLRSAETDLGTRACPAGVAAGLVDDCASRLRQESCHPLSTLSRMSACRPVALCVQMTKASAFWTPSP